uniref:ATP synthase complex subunit 8 n=1 Tax=Staphylinoidea sp. 11 KM-2017 TaxID=2219451 RepID=A0A346RHY6_9COLE|nr:ATP synthase F0 subunit 8 [Staphylinoidea sp. 11 KM-2017]
MPQMAPLNWLSLFLYFIFIFMLFNTLNYYSFQYSPIKTFTSKKTFKLNWKW